MTTTTTTIITTTISTLTTTTATATTTIVATAYPCWLETLLGLEAFSPYRWQNLFIVFTLFCIIVSWLSMSMFSFITTEKIMEFIFPFKLQRDILILTLIFIILSLHFSRDNPLLHVTSFDGGRWGVCGC